MAESTKLVDALEDEERWLALRHDYVTGSDLSVLMMRDEHPFKTRGTLFAEKVAKVGPAFGAKAQRKMAWGRREEAATLALVGEIVGQEVTSEHGFFRLSGSSIASTLDGRFTSTKINQTPCVYSGSAAHQRGLAAHVRVLLEGLDLETVCVPVEAKLTEAPFKGPVIWKTQVPEYYYWQVQAQIYSTNAPFALIAARIDAFDIRGYVITPDPRMAEAEVEATKFMKEVEDARRQFND